MSHQEQRSLFTASEQRALASWGKPKQQALDLGADSLQAWKAGIAGYQQKIQRSQPPQQSALFDIPSKVIDAATIDPFDLPLYNFHFFEWPADRHPDTPCIYFVIDTCLPLLLYVGETCKANQRWKGVHDCKQYVLNYQALHRQQNLPTAVNTAFWWNTPAQHHHRLSLESALIKRWRSPFNKENWHFWGTPFVNISK